MAPPTTSRSNTLLNKKYSYYRRRWISLQHCRTILPTVKYSGDTRWSCSSVSALKLCLDTQGEIWWFVMCCSWKWQINFVNVLPWSSSSAPRFIFACLGDLLKNLQPAECVLTCKWLFPVRFTNNVLPAVDIFFICWNFYYLAIGNTVFNFCRWLIAPWTGLT